MASCAPASTDGCTLRYAQAGDFALELVGRALFTGERLEVDDDLGELARATRLLLVGTDVLHEPLDGLLGNLRLADVGPRP